MFINDVGGGGGILTLYLLGTFFPTFALYGKDLCEHNRQRNFTIPTISKLNDKINITVTIKTNEYYVLMINGSIRYTSSSQTSDVNTNTTHFTLLTSCATATGSYMLQTGTHHGTTCQHFNITNTCPSDSTSTHLAQSSCSECEYAISTITPFVIIMFYSIF
nr:membrane glycoprotein E51 [Elephant endotheliotropic herpesvirus 1A]